MALLLSALALLALCGVSVHAQSTIRPIPPRIVPVSAGACDCSAGWSGSSSVCKLGTLQFSNSAFAPGTMYYTAFKVSNTFRGLQFGGFSISLNGTNSQVGSQAVMWVYGVAKSLPDAQNCVLATYNGTACAPGSIVFGVGTPPVFTLSTNIIQQTSQKYSPPITLIGQDMINAALSSGSNAVYVFAASMSTFGPVTVTANIMDVQSVNAATLTQLPSLMMPLAVAVLVLIMSMSKY